MKYCSVCAGAITSPFHQESWKDKCYNCHMKEEHPGWGDKDRIGNLLKKYSSSSKLKDGREMITNKKRKWAGFKYE